MLTGRHFALIALLTLWSHEGIAETSAVTTMTASQMAGASFLDYLSIPCPGEVFAALKKACHPNWVTLITPATAPVTTDRAQLALVVGVLAANGYIALEAQDGQQVKDVGREMMSMAKALGVSGHLMGRGSSLIEFAESNAWDSLADELEATESEIKSSMLEQKDHDLVTLSSVAGWVRGLDIATRVVLSSDTLQGAGVIRQADLARHLASLLGNLPERMKKQELVDQAQKILDEVAGLMENMGSTPETQRPVLLKIHEATESLVKAILLSSVNPLAKSSAVKTSPTSTPNLISTNAQGGKP